MVPLLVQAGHTVIGLDSDLLEQCTFHPGIFDVPQLRVDLQSAYIRSLGGQFVVPIPDVKVYA